MTRSTKSERDEAIARLRDWIKPGDTVYTILRHVSPSGMQREIGVVLLAPTKQNGDPLSGGSTYPADVRIVDLHPNHAVATALGVRLGKRDGVIVGGCGMDMGYHIVYSLARTLWPDGYGCTGADCPSNDHSNGDRDRTPHSEARPHWHQDGGYALRHRWL